MNLLRYTSKGIYCPKGDFYIDASGKVERNIITHTHADHARPGHNAYLAHKSSVPLLRERIGKNIRVQAIDYAEEISINGVKVSLHPAGHIYGSSQVKVSSGGEPWVVSGDYKLEDDGVCVPFEPVRCDVFITESTFGMPHYSWPDQQTVYRQINDWWKTNKEAGITSLLYGYALGKSQRILQNIDHAIGPIFVHRSIATMNQIIAEDGVKLPETVTINKNTNKEDLKGNLVIAPPSITSGRIMKGLNPVSVAMASGWIQDGKRIGKSSNDKGFILSDHADWQGLLWAINESKAEKVITMHGYTREFTAWLNKNGICSQEIDDLKNQPYSL